MSKDKELDIKSLFINLQMQGIVKVSIPFDGSGDSGSVQEDDIEAYILNPSTNEEKLADNHDDILTSSINSSLSDLAYHILDKYYFYDWYNNEGGYGTIHIDIIEQSWHIDGYQRIYTSEEAYEDGDLTTALESFIK